MVFDACASFEGERHWKQGSWWVVRQFCTQTMQPLAHRTKKTTKYFRTKAFKKKSKTIILLPFKKKREKEGELSGRFISWTQCKKHQSKSSYTNYTQPIRSASHHQRWAKLANQQASDAARDQSKKVGSPPNQIHIIQKKGEEQGERTEKRQKYRGMQKEEEPVHMKRHRKTHTWCEEKRDKESEQSIQMCSSSNERTNNKMRYTHTTYIWPFAYIWSNCTWAMMEKWWMEQEQIQRKEPR